MKKLMFALGAIAIVAAGSMFTSCKKGKNDPFLSFRSRKARLTNVWLLKEGTQTDVTTSSGGVTNTSTTTFTASEMTKTIGSNLTILVSSINRFEFSFESDGKYSLIISTTGKTTNGTAVPNPVTTTTATTGLWAFLGRNGERNIKNKEAIILSESTITYTTSSSAVTSTDSYAESGWASGDILLIDRLKNSEVVFTTGRAWSNANGSGSSESKMTFEAE